MQTRKRKYWGDYEKQKVHGILKNEVCSGFVGRIGALKTSGPMQQFSLAHLFSQFQNFQEMNLIAIVTGYGQQSAMNWLHLNQVSLADTMARC